MRRCTEKRRQVRICLVSLIFFAVQYTAGVVMVFNCRETFCADREALDQRCRGSCTRGHLARRGEGGHHPCARTPSCTTSQCRHPSAQSVMCAESPLIADKDRLPIPPLPTFMRTHTSMRTQARTNNVRAHSRAPSQQKKTGLGSAVLARGARAVTPPGAHHENDLGRSNAVGCEVERSTSRLVGRRGGEVEVRANVGFPEAVRVVVLCRPVAVVTPSRAPPRIRERARNKSCLSTRTLEGAHLRRRRRRVELCATQVLRSLRRRGAVAGRLDLWRGRVCHGVSWLYSS